MENEIIKKEDRNLLLATVAKGATEAEFQMFLEFCKSTGLNPFKKEIWFIKTGQGVQMMTGINGFLTIANNHPQFDGMTVKIDEQDGKLVSATCTVYRKDRKYPSEATVYYSEYAKNSPIWRTMPRMMLQKVAKSVALREAFPQELNGMYTQEEMPPEYSIQEKSENKTQYVYDVALYQDQEKVKGILEAFRKKGFKIENTLLFSNEPIQQLNQCLQDGYFVEVEENDKN